MTLSRRSFLVGSVAVLAARRARADGASASDIDGVLAQIAAARAGLRTMTGPFTQTRTIGLLATAVRSQGTMMLVRPDRLRWELAPPDDVTFWIGPAGLAYRSAHGSGAMAAPAERGDREDGNADAGAASRIGASLDDLRALLGGDLTRLRTRWTLVLVRRDASGVELEATARTPASGGVRSMRFALAADLVRPTRALLVEGPRDRTSIEFGDLRLNAPIDDAAMRPPR